MLVLSDMSGPSMAPGFETYFTGYPLPDDGLFALGRTWHAPEMARVGCVWTHTLLLDSDALENVRDVLGLVTLFQHPSNNSDFGNYSIPLALPSRATGTGLLGAGQEQRARSILAALYGAREPVFLVGEDAQTYEQLILAIWGQQWPHFRSRFSFCTGAIHSREYQGAALDLQVIPVSASRETRRRLPNSQVIERGQAESTNDVEKWVWASARDLCSDESGELRRFLWQLASDYQNGRAGFRSFVDAFDIVRTDDAAERKVPRLVSLVGERFQSSSEAQCLKIGLFGSTVHRKELRDVADITVVRALVTASHPTAFDADALALRDRSWELWREDRQLAADSLFKSFRAPSNHLQAAVASGVLERLDGKEICDVLDRFSDSLLPTVAHDQQLIRMPKVWKCRPETQRRLIGALTEISDWEAKERDEIVSAQLNAGANEIADQMATWLGTDVVRSVLNWISAITGSDSRHLPGRWQQILAEQPESVIDWLGSNPDKSAAVFLHLIEVLDPHSRALRKSPGTIWLQLADRATAEIEGNSLQDVMAFLLVTAFNISDTTAPFVVTRSFPVVYGAAAADSLSSRSLMILQSEFSGIGWHWDRCRRLRRGLVEKFAERSWPSEAFLTCTQDTNLLSLIYESWGWGRAETRFLRRVIKDAGEGAAHPTEKQQKMLASYRKWFD